MGRWHADAARRAGARVVAIVDTDITVARALAGDRAESRPSLSDALDLAVDVVHICTPLETHVALTSAALAAGCHVIVEKPATPTVREAELLADTARRAERLVVPVHQFTWQAGVQRIMARRTSIGPLRHLAITICSAGADGAPRAERDRIAGEISPHVFSLARAILDVDVGDLDWRLDRVLPGEWHLATTTGAGCSISALISMASRPPRASCQAFGEHGSAHADLFHGFAVFEPGSCSRTYKVIRPFAVGASHLVAAAAQLAQRSWRREAAYPGLRALCAATYASIARHGAPPFREGEVLDVAKARDRVLRLAVDVDRR